MIIQPKLLKSAAQRVETTVFVCGPGYGAQNENIRNTVRKELLNTRNVKVVYGEEIENIQSYKKRGLDLQTLEARFAHDVDFTILVLESPGSIAEVGTFSMLEGIRERMIVLVSSRFYRAESYIARGPLSILANANPNSIIYYDEDKLDDIRRYVLYPLTFYKFAHYIDGLKYSKVTKISQDYNVSKYLLYIRNVRKKYEMSITFICILIGGSATYAELLLLSGLSPRQLNGSLHALYEAEKIEKFGSGRYRTIRGYEDVILNPFSTTEISKCRARIRAAA